MTEIDFDWSLQHGCSTGMDQTRNGQPRHVPHDVHMMCNGHHVDQLLKNSMEESIEAMLQILHQKLAMVVKMYCKSRSLTCREVYHQNGM